MQDGEDGNADIGEDGHPHCGDAKDGKDEDEKFYEYGEEGVLPCKALCLAGDPHADGYL